MAYRKYLFQIWAYCILIPMLCPAAPADTFEISNTDFLLNGKPFVIRSGEMHACRIPTAYWRHRLEMVKAMGCNTVCAYLFWNVHEPVQGEFNFSGNADMAHYCRIAQEVGLKVILRPGPYSCAEWDFGGFPWWLLKDPKMELRTQYPGYLGPARRYLLEVGKQLAPLQITNGGPIIMVQVENEYGTYGSDKTYIGIIRDTLVEAGFNVPLFTCDGTKQLINDVRDDIFCVVNFGKKPAQSLTALRSVRPTGPLMCGEYYPGWFDHWGNKHHYGKINSIIGDLKYMLDNRVSFSIYMVHGGTSFGFWAGANSPPYKPQTTSYDYDAPISEAGWATEKYHAIRDLFGQYLQDGEILGDIPKPLPVIEIQEFSLTETADLFDQLQYPRHSQLPRPMETYDQGWGCILYRTTLPAGQPATLTIKDVHDCARIYMNRELIGSLDRRNEDDMLSLPERRTDVELNILVEAMGRINFGKDIHDRKGITQSVILTTDEQTRILENWQVYTIPLDLDQLQTIRYSTSGKHDGPAFYRGRFQLNQTGDTFLNMLSWKKGFVWVNGHNLGRYWNIGPQQTLYLPGCWLNKGDNEIIVFDLEGNVVPKIQGQKQPILDQL